MPKTTYYSAHTQPNGLALTYTPKNAAEIIAAGALIWRVRNSKIELLIIHRPRYDDWSWPKGKQDAGETIPETAIREISEEVQLRVHPVQGQRQNQGCLLLGRTAAGGAETAR